MKQPVRRRSSCEARRAGDILIIGTGLTSLDLLLTLDKTKREGKIHLLSRRGLFPQPHKKAAPYPAFLDPDNLPKTARGAVPARGHGITSSQCARDRLASRA